MGTPLEPEVVMCAIVGLTTADWLAIAGLVLAPLLAAAGFLVGRRRARLVFVQSGNVVVRQPNDDITIHWRDTQVTSVSRTRIVVWNAGNVTLEGDAVVDNYPLRFWFAPGAQVLSAEVVAGTHEENA